MRPNPMSPRRIRWLAPSTRPADKAVRLAKVAAVLTKLRRLRGAEHAASDIARGAFMQYVLGQLRAGTSKRIPGEPCFAVAHEMDREPGALVGRAVSCPRGLARPTAIRGLRA